MSETTEPIRIVWLPRNRVLRTLYNVYRTWAFSATFLLIMIFYDDQIAHGFAAYQEQNLLKLNAMTYENGLVYEDMTTTLAPGAIQATRATQLFEGDRFMCGGSRTLTYRQRTTPIIYSLQAYMNALCPALEDGMSYALEVSWSYRDGEDHVRIIEQRLELVYVDLRGPERDYPF